MQEIPNTPPETLLTACWKFTTPFEGKIPYLYRDTIGILTVGVGFTVPTLESAMAIGLKPVENIPTDYLKVQTLPIGRVAKFYEPYTVSRLPINLMRELFDIRMEQFYLSVMESFNLKEMPQNAQVAVLDMAFNLGATALKSRWPRFKSAVLNGDWETAAQECWRKGIGNSRNTGTQNLLRSCIK